MNHIKSYGICTRNEQGMFEVHWEVESTWYKKLFKIPTEFKYVCGYSDGELFTTKGYIPESWYDLEFNRLTDVNTIHELRFVLQCSSYTNNCFN